eukprot:9243373-Pyramimonas_sp.AAC.1
MAPATTRLPTAPAKCKPGSELYRWMGQLSTLARSPRRRRSSYGKPWPLNSIGCLSVSCLLWLNLRTGGLAGPPLGRRWHRGLDGVGEGRVDVEAWRRASPCEAGAP